MWRWGLLAGSAALNEMARRQRWIQYADALVGIWFIVAPWALSFAGRTGDFYTFLILGIVALILSVWNLYILSEAPAKSAQRAH